MGETYIEGHVDHHIHHSSLLATAVCRFELFSMWDEDESWFIDLGVLRLIVWF